MVGRLALCAVGIYAFFLTWGILQERITTVEYVSLVNGQVQHSKFKFFIFLNFIQSMIAVLISYVFLRVQRIGLGPKSRDVLLSYLRLSFGSCIASPFGYESLRHINYPTMILGKSCKLVPVMLMNFLVYRRRFETYKYVTVGLITLGVTGFMMAEPHRGSVKAEVANSLYGLLLLLVNLLIDGATNSLQDQIFIRHRVRSQQMMFFMNLFSGSIMLAWMLFNPWNTELRSAIAFGRAFPSLWLDIVLFCACGALGQIFIFYTIEHFGSLSLVTITVTRKLFTILLSLFWFDHKINAIQWGCVMLVFAALAIESFYKQMVSSSKAAPQQPAAVEEKTARVSVRDFKSAQEAFSRGKSPQIQQRVISPIAMPAS